MRLEPGPGEDDLREMLLRHRWGSGTVSLVSTELAPKGTETMTIDTLKGYQLAAISARTLHAHVEQDRQDFVDGEQHRAVVASAMHAFSNAKLLSMEYAVANQTYRAARHAALIGPFDADVRAWLSVN